MLDDIFYYTDETNQRVYTDIPQGEVEPSRLLLNQPAFITRASSLSKKPKIIILPVVITIKDDCVKARIKVTLVQLMNRGFTIYFNNTQGKLDLFANIYFERTARKRTALSLASISTLLDIPAEQILLLSEEQLYKLMSDIAKQVDTSNPKSLTLINNPMTESQFFKLLVDYKDQLERLEITDCPCLYNLTWVITLPHLKYLSVKLTEFSEYIEVKPQIYIRINTTHPALKIELDLERCDLLELPPANLSKLHLKMCTVSEQLLQRIFESSRNLVDLSLTGSGSFKSLSFDPTLRPPFLPNLKSLALVNLHLIATTALSILAEAPLLESLECSKIFPGPYGKDGQYKDLGLTHLKHLRITDVHFLNSEIQAIISQATQLQQIHLHRDRSYGNHELIFPRTTSLQKLELVYQKVNQTSLNYLIADNAHCLEELFLQSTETSLSCTQPPLGFPNLRSIHLSNTDVNDAYFSALIAQSTFLEVLHIFENKASILKLNVPVLSLSQLKRVYINRCTIDCDALQKIFDAAHQVTDVTLTKCTPSDDPNTLHNVKLPRLKHLDISDDYFKTPSIEALIANTSKIEYLSIKKARSERLNLALLSAANLKYFHLTNTDLAGESLEITLMDAKVLQSMSLTESTLHWNNINTNQLPRLTNLELNSVTFKYSDIIKFLQHTPVIKQIYFHDISITDTWRNESMNNINLVKLKTLFLYNVHHCHAAFIAELLAHAPNIKAVRILDSSLIDQPVLPLPHSQLPHFNKLGLVNFRDSTFVAPLILVLVTNAPKLHRIDNLALTPLEVKQLRFWLTSNTTASAHAKILVTNLLNEVNPESTPKNTPLPALDTPTQRMQPSYGDADVRAKNTHFNCTRLFIGKPTSPNPTLTRLNGYSDCSLNPQCTSINDVFLLSNQSRTNLSYWNLLPLRPAAKPLAEQFQAQKQAHLGRFHLTLSTTWQRLPGVTADEELLAYYLSPTLPVELLKNQEDGFHYIRTPTNQPTRVKLELLLSAPAAPVRFNELPEGIRSLVKFFRGFREVHDALELQGNGPLAKQYFTAFKTQRAGSCRHRAMVFKLMMQDAFPHIRVQILANGNAEYPGDHMYTEIRYNGAWVTCDLGGYAAETHYDNPYFPEENARPTALTDPLAHPEEVYTLSFAPRGKPLPAGFYERAKNIASIHVTGELNRFPDAVLRSLDTLVLEDCALSAAPLISQLAQTKELKTLKLLQCRMTPAEFHQLDFSMLKRIEYIELSGSFIPDERALQKLMATVKLAVQWVIDSVNIDREMQHLELPDSTDNRPVANKPATARERAPEEPLLAAAEPATKSAKPGATELIPAKPRIKRLLATPELKLPVARYFKPLKHKTLAQLEQHNARAILLYSSNPKALAYTMQQRFNASNTPCFYAAKPEALYCNKPFIHRHPDLTGEIRRGPGGALYDFIQQHPQGILLINYEHFRAADVVRLNSIYDQRILDGVALPERLKLIGLMNPESPNAYLESDFTSRFQLRARVDAPPIPEPQMPAAALPQAHCIELAGGMSWEARLIGFWLIDGLKLRYQEGALIQALRQGHRHIVLNNPPDDAEYRAFLTSLHLHQAVVHQGRREMALPEGFTLACTHLMNLAQAQTYVHAAAPDAPLAACAVLNSALLSRFIGTYTKDPASTGLLFQAGLLAQKAGGVLPVYLTQSLTEHDWYALVDCAASHQTTLQLSLAPEVVLPKLLQHLIAPKTRSLPQAAHTEVLISAEGALERYPDLCIPIDVTELHAADLLPCLQGTFDEARLEFAFIQQDGFLEQALAEGKHVVLHGLFQQDLHSALHPLLLQRLTQTEVKGTLTLVCHDRSLFALVSNPTQAPAWSRAQPIAQAVTVDERLQAAEEAAKNNKIVLLTGSTGAGKTWFMDHQWQATHSTYTDIAAWIADRRPGVKKTLFADEVNMANRQWGELGSVQHNPPGIFYQRRWHLLTPEHHVFMACNPQAYGGERTRPRILNAPHAELLFLPLCLQTTLTSYALPHAIQAPIQRVIAFTQTLRATEVILTPRELMMMVAATQAACHTYPKLKPGDAAAHFAYHLTRHHIPQDYQAAFHAHAASPRLDLALPALQDITLTCDVLAAYEALTHQLNLREYRKTHADAPSGGLGGIILEGEPGVCKTKLIQETLRVRAYRAAQDYCFIPVSWSDAQKTQALLHAFHQGLIAIIDELNSSPLMERTLNALLEGHDTQGKPPEKPGFMLIGMQNPMTRKGRVKTTLPVRHRMETVVIQHPNPTETKAILSAMGLPPAVMHAMVDDYQACRKLNDALCFRDLIECATRWMQGNQQPIQVINVKPLAISGSLCKVIAIASIDHYYAAHYGYQPLPFFAQHSGQLSQRHLAKRNASCQGEILEWSRWQEQVHYLGYNAQTIDFAQDNNRLLKAIKANLCAGNLLLIAFCVKHNSGHPDPHPEDPQKREHAAVITGYNAQTDEVTLCHWGATYQVDFALLFHSNQALLTTRTQEFYRRNPDYEHDKRDHTAKYLPADAGAERASIIPKPNTGFKSKVMVVEKPQATPQWLEQRRQMQASAGGFFKAVRSNQELPQANPYAEQPGCNLQ